MQRQPDGVCVTPPGSSNYEQTDEPFDAADDMRCTRGDWDFVEDLKDFDGRFRLSKFIQAPEQQEKPQAHPEQKQGGLLFLCHPRISLHLLLSAKRTNAVGKVSSRACLLQADRPEL